jgi:hypothetical protein
MMMRQLGGWMTSKNKIFTAGQLNKGKEDDAGSGCCSSAVEE